MATKRKNENEEIALSMTKQLAVIEEILSDPNINVPITKLTKIFTLLEGVYSDDTDLKKQARLTNEVYKSLSKYRRL
jgi:hypothetical protein